MSVAAASEKTMRTGDEHDLLRRVLRAQVYEVARETPLDEAPLLSARLGHRVLLKREDLQSVFSFKLRGAYNKMAQLDHAERERGVIAASAGNHAQGVALAAARLGIRAVIVMPITAPQVKVDAVRRFGGAHVEIVLIGDSYSDAQAHAARLQAQQGLTLVHPFDDLDVIAGQGTIGMEIVRQHAHPLHAIFVPIGGGGLIAGIGGYIKALRPDIRIIGVQASDADAMARSIDAGRRVTLSDVGLFADGTAVKQPGEWTYALCRQYVDEILRVDTDAICAAIRDIFQETRVAPEPSGALALAGLKQYAARPHGSAQTLAAIVSGANLNFDRLRFVAERAEVGERHEAIFAVSIPEERGSFRRFCAALGERNITEFNYRIGNAEQAHIFVGIQTRHRGENATLLETFCREGFNALDLTDDELAKLHLRHMVGGRSAQARDEQLYRFDFPERPGALTRFLDHMHPDWNISLFHYRNHGADYGRILVGIQVPQAERATLTHFLSNLGYPYQDESDNPAYRLLLRED
ncbi:threonine ammonia-lyase, biosynthetic [Dyella sp.]|uniref:threonine ammonia-lyase, biosynthetic n=1 Tax=Dyella sp. TaxID=1869338 RepID=UPI002ED4C13E